MIYKFCDWVDIDRLDWTNALSYILNKYNLIEENLHRMNHENMCLNEYAVAYLNHDQINWENLSSNPRAMWILNRNVGLIDWSRLHSNPNAVELLIRYSERIDWLDFCSNESPDIISFLEKNEDKMHLNERYLNELMYNDYSCDILGKNLDRVCFHNLSCHEYAVPILQKNKDRIKTTISCNESDWAISFLEENPHLIDWYLLSRNRNPKVLNILKKNFEDIDWRGLSTNPIAIELLEQHPDKISWDNVSRNPNAIRLLEQNPHKINWDNLSSNPNAGHLLQQNPDKINWYLVSYNRNVLFEYDYAKMKTKMDIIREDLMMKCLHPSRVCRWIEYGGVDCEF